MHRFITGGAILEHELSELRLLVERHTGILLDAPNSAIASHVSDYLERHDLGSTDELFALLRSPEPDSALLSQFLHGLINSTSGFFRHPGAMTALARYVLPQIHSRKSTEGPCTLRIWSAGCGSGEEPYSIAMALCDAIPSGTASATRASSNGNGNGNSNGAKATSCRNGGIAETSIPVPSQLTKEWAIHIVGSDLLAESIKIGERGVYPESAVAGLPPAAIRSCFTKISSTAGAADRSSPSGYLMVKPRLRSMVTFNTMNLIHPVYIGRFDCIFCMDVLPHLSRPQRLALLERLHLYLEPGGYLFLSQTEKLSSQSLNFRSEVFDGYTMYRKPLAAGAAYGR